LGSLRITLFKVIVFIRDFRGFHRTALSLLYAVKHTRVRAGNLFSFLFNDPARTLMTKSATFQCGLRKSYPCHYSRAFAFWPLSYPLVVTII